MQGLRKMIDIYETEERVAIRQFCGGMTERAAIAMTHAENQSKSMFKRVAEMAKHQREHAAPAPLRVPTREPVTCGKDRAAGQ